jgi:hypothetical protein
MKKLALSLLLSTTLLINNFSSQSATTNLGPIQIITLDGSNQFAPGTINLSGTINIGNSSNDIITFQGNGITNPGLGSQNFVMLSSNGQVVTSNGSDVSITFGNFSAANTPSQTINLGITDGTGNGLNFTNDSGDVILQASANLSNLKLETPNNIFLISPTLTSGLNTNSFAVLGINANGQLSTNGQNLKAYFQTLNTENTSATNLNVAENFIVANLLDISSNNNTITLGNNSTSIDFVASSNIIYPNANNFSLLAIDSAGTLVSTSDTTPIACGTLTAGNITGANLTAATTAGQTVTLGNSTGLFTLAGLNITPGTNGGINFLGVGANGALSTVNSSENLQIGSLTAAPNAGQTITFGSSTGDANYFFLNNNTNDVILQANAIGANLKLLTPSGHIIIQGIDIATPTSGNNFLLQIDSNGIVGTADTTSPLSCGSLNAASSANNTVSLGIDTSSGNSIGFNSSGGAISIAANASGSSIDLTASDNIYLAANSLNLNLIGVTPTLNTSGNVVLAVDRNGNVVTSDSNNIFKFGSDAANNNFIAIDNSIPANGITLNSQGIYLTDSTLIPAAGSTNLLTIDSNGKIGIVVSTETKKENIKTLNLDRSFDGLTPVSYNYKGQNEKTQYGFIAESLVNNESLKNTVIYDKNGKPMSVDYTAIFVALTANYLEYKKILNAELNNKNQRINELEKKCQLLEAAIKEIVNEIAMNKKN